MDQILMLAASVCAGICAANLCLGLCGGRVCC